MNFSRRAGVAVALGALLSLPLVACGTNNSSTSQSSTASPASPSVATTQSGPAPGLAKFYAQTVQWGSCADYAKLDGDLPPDLQCGRVTVPVDYANPTGPTAQIALSRAKATGAKVGSLFINPGGPGGAGLWTASLAAGTPVAEHFDRIGFDPRGIGASLPAIQCVTAAQFDAARQKPDWDNSPAGIARQEQEHRDYAAGCTSMTGNDFLQHVGTREVVQDLDIMRAAVGDPKLTYLGYSYGTRIGWTYAERFPGNIRAMVIDGVVDPNANAVQESLAQSGSFQKVFQDFAASCAATAGANCPLGQDPAQASAEFRKLTVPLETKNVPTKDPRGLGYTDALTGTEQALYTPNLWPGLIKGLTELRDGRGDALLQLADMYEDRNANGTYDNSQAAFNSVNCVDDPPMNNQDVVDQLDAKSRQVAPFTDDGKGTGHAPLDLCTYWPVRETSAPHTLNGADLRSRGLPTLVVVSTTDDPATPYQQGVNVANELGARLVTFKGNQHTASFSSSPGSTCVDNAATSYLVDLKLPESGLTCEPNPKPAQDPAGN